MEPLHVGIDFGSTALRVAYATEGAGVISLEHELADAQGWLRCERSPSSRLGMSFPSIKSRLGGSTPRRDDVGEPAQAQLLTDALARVRREVEEQTNRPVTQAVICVPALYSTSQRAALHDMALTAGFGAAHLINDSVSAVTAHAAGRPSPATVLVFGAGYQGFELGLARVVKGHVRVLAYEGGRAAGAALDQLVLDGALQAITDAGWVLDEARWGAAQWLHARATAQAVKEQLGSTDQAGFPMDVISRSRKTAQVWFARQPFEEVVREVFGPAVDLVGSLLQKADMVRADLDAVVLTGGTTRLPVLRALLAEAVGRSPIVAPPESLAVGAALHAAGLGSTVEQVLFEAERAIDVQEAEVSPAHTVALRATVDPTERAPADPDRPATATPLNRQDVSEPAPFAPGSLDRYVSRLVDSGEVERARTELADLIRAAQAALDGLPGPPEHAALGPTSPAYRSRLALTNARSLLQRRQFARAVGESHYAWELSPDDPEILDAMIDIHCQAADGSGAPEQYEDAVRWLECALSHNESNPRIRSLLAERHFVQARKLHRRGQLKEALHIAEHCLRWNPHHPGAAELQRTLTCE